MSEILEQTKVFTSQPELNKENNKIDYLKFGFQIQSEREGIKEYVASFGNRTVILTVLGNIHTIEINTGYGYIMVANRYIVTTQEQLDWIILNGRAGVLFMPSSC